ARMTQIFDEYRPELVFHAAAHKHVPLMESNVGEAVKNNVLGTAGLAELAGQFKVSQFVLVSTDKAVRPTSVMGTTKRIAELTIQQLNQKYATQYMAVRFGNVLGSAGSVVPIFRGQIKSGGPVTVTHPDMVRFFMTIPEASQLVLQAGAMGQGGEVFVLDMGEPIRVQDLAREMIKLSGLVPEVDVEIVFTGIRPGEKLYEEIQYDGELMERTRHPKIYIGSMEESHQSKSFETSFDLLRLALDTHREDEMRKAMCRLVPESTIFHPEGVQSSNVVQLSVENKVS
ncbi:MAG: polysaccharide biosynthesis protein, partial [Deltaproteobacteria bacterium]|nr:polysaccharide biosynthesis protein [Deltaproteobacteria bacterium]